MERGLDPVISNSPRAAPQTLIISEEILQGTASRLSSHGKRHTPWSYIFFTSTGNPKQGKSRGISSLATANQTQQDILLQLGKSNQRVPGPIYLAAAPSVTVHALMVCPSIGGNLVESCAGQGSAVPCEDFLVIAKIGSLDSLLFIDPPMASNYWLCIPWAKRKEV